MFVKRKVRYSALFTNLVGWHAGAVSFPPSDVILAQLACLLSDVMFAYILEELSYFSTNIDWHFDSDQNIFSRRSWTG